MKSSSSRASFPARVMFAAAFAAAFLPLEAGAEGAEGGSDALASPSLLQHAPGGEMASGAPVPPSGSESSAPPEGNAGSTALPSGRQRRIERYKDFWNSLIPSHARLQFAGSMGLASTGIGWEYGYRGGFRHFENDLLLGIIPKYNDDHVRWTMTLRQNFMPWFVPLGGQFYLVPFTTGFSFTTIFGDEYWTKEPGKYPKGYYWFSTRLRVNVYAGQGLTWFVPDKDTDYDVSVTVFYEIGTNDLLFLTAQENEWVKWRDALKLSLGIKVQWL